MIAKYQNASLIKVVKKFIWWERDLFLRADMEMED